MFSTIKGSLVFVWKKFGGGGLFRMFRALYPGYMYSDTNSYLKIILW